MRIAVVGPKGQITYRDASAEEVQNLAALGHEEAASLLDPVQPEPKEPAAPPAPAAPAKAEKPEKPEKQRPARRPRNG
ncbi:hypothetical protein [Planktothrix phage Pra-JY27]|nr:putative repeat protein [Planktothrix phage Pag-Yong1]WEV89191.1 hypothetical protein [Synechococcus phage MinM2]